MPQTLTLDMVYRNIDAWRSQLQATGGSHDRRAALTLGMVLIWIEQIGDDVPDDWGMLGDGEERLGVAR